MTCELTLMIVFLLFMVRRKNREIINPLNIFLVFWMVIIFLYSIRLYELNDVSNNTWLIITLGIISYYIGYNIFIFNYKRKKVIFKDEEIINIKILTILALIAIVVILPVAKIQFINVMQGNTFGDNKHLLMNNEVSLGVGYIYIAKPLRIVLSLILVIMISSKKVNKTFCIAVFLLMLIDFMCTGSKVIFFTFGIHILFMIMLKNNLDIKKIIFKNSKKILIGISLIVGIIYYMSINSNKSVFEKLYYYIVGCIPFLDYSLSNIDFKYSRLTFGFVTLNGLLRIPFTMLNMLGIDYYPNLLLTADEYLVELEKFIYLNDNTIFNAFSTIFFNLYADGRYFGVMLGMFSFGMISSILYKKLKSKSSNYYYLLYLFIVNMIINSQAKSLLTNVAYGMSILYIITIIKIILNKKIIIGKYYER